MNRPRSPAGNASCSSWSQP